MLILLAGGFPPARTLITKIVVSLFSELGMSYICVIYSHPFGRAHPEMGEEMCSGAPQMVHVDVHIHMLKVDQGRSRAPKVAQGPSGSINVDPL